MKKIFLCALVLTLACCGKANFSEIKIGMTVKEVENLVGKPDKQQDNPMFGKWYVYKDNIVIFNNDTVVKSTTKKEFENKLDNFTKSLDSIGSNIDKIVE